MLENIFEYIAILILIIGIIIYLLRDTIKEYFQPTPVLISPPAFSRKVKDGYLSLLDLLYHNSNKNDLEKEIRYVATQRSDGRYVGGYTKDTDEFDSVSFSLDYFYDILNYSDARRENFIPSLDWKATIEELNGLLEHSLGGLLKGVNLPMEYNYPKDVAISYKSILSDYQKVLNQHKIQMALLNDGSDTYYIVLHPLDKEHAVEKAVGDIGFDYNTTLN